MAVENGSADDTIAVNGLSNGLSNGHVNGAARSSHLTAGVNGHIPCAEPIAICGLALRLPGGITDASTFWTVLHDGIDTRSQVPPSRYNAAGFSDARGRKSIIKPSCGYFLQEDLSTLDTSLFGMAKLELEKADPQQRQLLEVTRECLENAGEVGYRGKQIGCYVGTFGEDWLTAMSKDTQLTGSYNVGGDLLIANRISYEYDFRGPSVVVKTGCSASLVGLHEACRALQCGDCSSALVAGTSLIMGPTTSVAMTHEGILSPEGSCKTFDAAADGFARAEAINAVYIKKLSDAIRDGNPVRAVIRSTGSNSDGKSQGLMQPSGQAHEALMRKVYADAGLDPRDTAFVECHGTGTATGDPIEATAVGNVFGGSGVFIGSVKPNVGHSEGASGMTSLIKAVLALEHEMIPPNIKFARPNPKIPFEEKKLVVPLQPTAWPRDRALRISVNSFGIGGSNAHAVVESAKMVVQPAASASAAADAPQLLTFSAGTQNSLQRLVENYRDYLQHHPERLADLSYTLTQRRGHLAYRAYAVCRDGALSSVSASAKVSGSRQSVAMVFTGQGAQWPRMGAELIASCPEVRKDLQAMDDVLSSLKLPPKWSLSEELSKPAETSGINRAELAQPICTAVQICIVNALGRGGIHPDSVVGHSSGEIAAAYAAGAISMPEAMVLAYYRGYVSTGARLSGGMAAIGLGADEVSKFLQGDVVVACENSPSSTTISGSVETLCKVLRDINQAEPEVQARQLKVDMAYHSSHMKGLAADYVSLAHEELVAKKLLALRRDPQVPFFSSVTAKRLATATAFDVAYWGVNMAGRVRFRSAVHSLLADQQLPNPLFLEIGPHATLAGPLRQICAEKGTACGHIATMVRHADGAESLLAAYGQLYQRGVDVDFGSIVPAGKVLTDLPAYPWDHSGGSFWHENRVSQAWRLREFGHHSLLGQRTLESTSLMPSWRVVLELEDEPWLADHRVRDDVVFPFAGYISMAGEALRQLTGAESGYSLRHVLVHTALVLVENRPMEMMTMLRRARLTDASDADAYDFTISSCAGGSHTWIKNCEGRVQPPPADVRSSAAPDGPLPREVKPARWYDAMARVGLVYGPEFKGLQALRASTTSPAAEGTIASPEAHQNAPFHFHPADMDACLQLGLAAQAQGAGRNLSRLWVPTLIEEVDIGRSASNMSARAWRTQQGELAVDCVADGRLALRLRGARLTPLDQDDDDNDEAAGGAAMNRHAGGRLRWFPDFDFMDQAPLFSPAVTEADTPAKLVFEELCLLCLVDSAERLDTLGQPQEPHFARFRAWLRRQAARAKAGDHPIVADAAALANLPRAARWEAIAQRLGQMSRIHIADTAAKGLLRICENAEGLFTGTVDALDLLMQDGVLSDFYTSVSIDFSKFVRALVANKPTMRILEVGGGTGGTTELILRDLLASSDAGGHPPYACYTFTDVSASFFPQAVQRFAYAPNMEYKAFDIGGDPFAQGFEPQAYDLILASNVVHATPSLNATLKNLQPLLRPDGHLVLSEVTSFSDFPGYVFGSFSGWWLGEADDRKDQPFVHVDRWDRELKAAGFTGADVVALDSPEPYHYCAAITAQPARPKAAVEDMAVTVLCEQPREGISSKVISDLGHAGFDVSVARFGKDALSEHRDVICTLDLEKPFFEAITAARLAEFQEMIRRRRSSAKKMLWLMPRTQLCCTDPRAAPTAGVCRSVRNETGVTLATLEISAAEPAFCSHVVSVLGKIRASEASEKLNPDWEFAVDAGVIKIGRFAPFSIKDELAENNRRSGDVVKTLEIAKPGMLDTLHWVEHRRLQGAVGDDEVAVLPKAVGLNFKDIVLSMGVLSSGSSTPPLGLELSGVVQRVGKNVSHVQPGDRVCAVAASTSFTTEAVLPSPMVAKIPDSLTFEEAATMPCVFVTAVQSLIEVGRLEKGQTVLIHSGAGGVGHAAIQICQMIGAEIFLTCSKTKAQYLHETFGVPHNRIFNSRDDSFLAGVMRETNGRGVDLVLNSLAGELLHASWKCVAQFGMLVELGKRDLAGFGKLDMEPFLMNRSYCSVDVALLGKERPKAMQRVMEKWLDLYRCSQISPIRPTTVFSATEVEQAFRYLQKGEHIGKAVVAMPEDACTLPSLPRSRSVAFGADSAYLLVGGLGGIGKSVANWMVERGARHLVFLSRSAGKTDEDKVFFAELASQGCFCHAVNGKVDDIESVQRAVIAANRPIRGVAHMPMVLRDRHVLDLTHAEWTETVQPKVEGAWNLHNALMDQDLDFFIMASSLVTLGDQPGQANYVAANVFLESFCQYRHSLGMPASVLGICPIEDVGFVADNLETRRSLKMQGFPFLEEPELLKFLELAVLNSRPSATGGSHEWWESSSHFIMGLYSPTHLDDPDCHIAWRRDRRMGWYHNLPRDDAGHGGNGSSGDSNVLKTFLARAAGDPNLLADKQSAEFLATEIGRRVFRLMMKDEQDLQISSTLVEIGMDSLMAIELRRWWKQAFGTDVSVLEIMGAGTLEELGRVAAEVLSKKFAAVSN